jgi:hypothetical protein
VGTGTDPLRRRQELAPRGGHYLFGPWHDPLTCSSPGTPNPRLLARGFVALDPKWAGPSGTVHCLGCFCCRRAARRRGAFMSEEHSNEEYVVGQYGCANGRDYFRVSTKHAECWAIGKLSSNRARFRWSGQAARPRCPTRGRGKQAVRSTRQTGSITAERRARTARTDDGAKGRRQARPTGAELAE